MTTRQAKLGLLVEHWCDLTIVWPAGDSFSDICYGAGKPDFQRECHAFEAGNLAGDRLAFYATTLPALALGSESIQERVR
jgi:hypothetical protein